MTTPAVPLNYVHKGPNIEVVSATDLEAAAAWLTLQLPPSFTVTVNESMGGSVFYGEMIDGQMMGKIVYRHYYFVKDSNGKIFVLDQNTLDCFYDQAP